MSEGVPITNTLFPPPPAYYKAFTPDAVRRYAELRPDAAEASSSTSASASGSRSHSPTKKAKADPEPAQPGELERLAAELDPPRADWVREDGRWMLFGQMYTTEPHIPTARDIGLPALVADPVSAGGDSERAALPTLLHSFLHTLLALIDTLTVSARNPGELEMAGRASEGDQYIQHLSNLAATMMVSANQLRGVQAEATLVMLMEKQVEERRAQTAKLREKCAEVTATIKRLKSASAAVAGEAPATEGQGQEQEQEPRGQDGDGDEELVEV